MSGRRLLLIGSFTPGDLAASYAAAFRRQHARVVTFDSDQAYFHAGVGAGNRWTRRVLRPLLWGRVNRATLALVDSVRPDAVVVFKGAYLEAATVRAIRRTRGIPVVNYYADNPFCGVPLNPRKTSAQRRDLLDVLKEYTRVWTWEPGLVARLNTIGVDAAYLPFGVDHEAYNPDAGAPPPCEEGHDAHDVVLIGQHNDKRERHLAAIQRHAVGVWGSRWSSAGGRLAGRHHVHQAPMWGAATAQRYRAAAVSLNVVDDLNMPGHNMRTFEIPASGGLMLASHTAEQAAIFPDGEAALYYRDPRELDDLIGRVLSEPRWAEGIRRRALAIARGHSYDCRAATMFADLAIA